MLESTRRANTIGINTKISTRDGVLASTNTHTHTQLTTVHNTAASDKPIKNVFKNYQSERTLEHLPQQTIAGLLLVSSTTAATTHNEAARVWKQAGWQSYEANIQPFTLP
jgi:hypothetical protein